jgi:hypothetical protein
MTIEIFGFTVDPIPLSINFLMFVYNQILIVQDSRLLKRLFEEEYEKYPSFHYILEQIKDPQTGSRLRPY